MHFLGQDLELEPQLTTDSGWYECLLAQGKMCYSEWSYSIQNELQDFRHVIYHL